MPPMNPVIIDIGSLDVRALSLRLVCGLLRQIGRQLDPLDQRLPAELRVAAGRGRSPLPSRRCR